MRFRKTPANKRTTYKQYDENGKLLYEFDPETDDQMTELNVIQKKDLVKAMHAVDDAEVRANCKEIRLSPEDRAQREEAREQFIRAFEEEHGYKPHPADLPGIHRTYIYLDDDWNSGDDEDNNPGDSSRIQAELAVNPFAADDQETAVDCMRGIVAGFTERERQVYQIVFREGKTQFYASLRIGVTEQRVGQIVKDIKKKLAGNQELKKYFRTL